MITNWKKQGLTSAATSSPLWNSSRCTPASCEWVMSHISISHVTCMTESCQTYEQVLWNSSPCTPASYEWVMSRVLITEPWHTYERVLCNSARCTPASYEWVMSHVRKSDVTTMDESCHTYERVMLQLWMSHVTHMKWDLLQKSSFCTIASYEWVISHVWTSHVKSTNELCRTYE